MRINPKTKIKENRKNASELYYLRGQHVETKGCPEMSPWQQKNLLLVSCPDVTSLTFI